MIRFEYVVVAMGKLNGAWDDPNSRAFKLRNPLLLKTWRPERKTDSDHYREFTSFMGGFKAGLVDVLSKCDAKNNKLTSENTLRDLLQYFGYHTDLSSRPIILFLRRSLGEDVSLETKLGWFQEDDTPVEPVEPGEPKILEKEN